MQVDNLTSDKTHTDFDDLNKISQNRVPRKYTFLKSRRCKILVIIGILLVICIVALLATTYTIAFTAVQSTKSTTSSTTILSLTYQRITNPGDPVTAIYNATAGGPSLNSSSGYGVGQYPPGQGPDAAIDLANTTYLNFGNVGQNLSGITNTAGVGTGLYIIPSVGASILLSIEFQSGNDSADRDPLTITVEGTNANGIALNNGSVWYLLYSGDTGLAPLNVTRLAWGDPHNLTNTLLFTAYRMIVTSQRGADDCTEFAEMGFYGMAY